MPLLLCIPCSPHTSFVGMVAYAGPGSRAALSINGKSSLHKRSHDILRATDEQVEISPNFFCVNPHPPGVCILRIATVNFGSAWFQTAIGTPAGFAVFPKVPVQRVCQATARVPSLWPPAQFKRCDAASSFDAVSSFLGFAADDAALLQTGNVKCCI